MSGNNAESHRNDAIRTLAIFFAATAVGLLSFVEAVFANRGSLSSKGRVSNDVVVTCLLLSMLFSLSVAALRRPQGNTQVADFILRLSFFTLLTGMMVFSWVNQPSGASIVISLSFGLLAIAYLTWTDPMPEGEKDRFQDKIVRYWGKWHGLGQSTQSGLSGTPSKKIPEDFGQNSVERDQYYRHD